MSGHGITIERIRERAYDIWDRNHRPEGFDVEFWLMAERELRAEAQGGLQFEGSPMHGIHPASET